jgi:hypothetical protein
MRLEYSALFNKKFLEEVTMPVLVPQIVTAMMRIQEYFSALYILLYN